MEPIAYIRASTADIPLLLHMRRMFSLELGGPQPEGLEETVDENVRDYFARELNRNYFSWYATVDGEPAAMAGMVVRTQPGSPKNPTGRWGYLLLVYTKPQYRKRGLAGKLVQHLVGTAKEIGITALELHATAGGEPVYQREGFTNHNEPTYRMFI